VSPSLNQIQSEISYNTYWSRLFEEYSSGPRPIYEFIGAAALIELTKVPNLLNIGAYSLTHIDRFIRARLKMSKEKQYIQRNDFYFIEEVGRIVDEVSKYS
jgi:hypothetical protein